MDWSTLLSVLLGGILATIPIIISNRFQAREREKDRQEKRREASIQAKEKWIQRDILTAMNSIDEILKLTSGAVLKKSKLTPPELVDEVLQVLDIMARQVFSFDDEVIEKAYRDFHGAIQEFLKKEVRIHTKKGAEEESITEQAHVRETAGKFQKVLRQKMIALYDAK